MKNALFAGPLATYLAVGFSMLGIVVACSDTSSDAPNTGSAGTNSAGAPNSPEANDGGSSHSGDNDNGSGAKAGSKPSSDPAGDPYGSGGEATHEGGASHGEGGVADGNAGAGGEAPCVPAAPTLPTNVSGLVAAPVDATLLRHFHAVGTQNYRCTMTPGDAGADPKYGWTFIGPVADMLNGCGVKVGSHFAAPNSDPPAPEWQYDIDGSSVVGEKINASPVAGAIPELLLKGKTHGGNGVFTNVTFVQRLRTVGGVMPDAASCDAEHVDDEQDVGYTAEYYFYSGGT